jgi:hypothetical protein
MPVPGKAPCAMLPPRLVMSPWVWLKPNRIENLSSNFVTLGLKENQTTQFTLDSCQCHFSHLEFLFLFLHISIIAW